MRTQLIVLSAVCALGLGISQACAEDGVIVDLSVLNSLQASSPAVNPQPLFPEYKKTTPQKAVKARQKRKAAKIKAAKVNKVEVVEKAPLPIKKAEPVEIKNVQPAPAVFAAPESDAASNREFVAEIENGTSQDVSQPENVSVPVSQAESFSQPVAEKTAISESAPVIENSSLAEEKTVSPESEAPKPLPAVIEPETPVKPLISDEQVVRVPERGQISSTLNSITFEEDSAELSEAHKQQINSIVRSFEDTQKNKILILAYNFDDGQDVFKKKRQSLNRAIEVRSFLLGQGYKNFSIKVINIADDNNKRNVVEIEELK